MLATYDLQANIFMCPSTTASSDFSVDANPISIVQSLNQLKGVKTLSSASVSDCTYLFRLSYLVVRTGNVATL
jgi:hypothetical protein